MKDTHKPNHCDDCALGQVCFHETQSPADFRDMIHGHQHFDNGQVIYHQGAGRSFAAVVQSGAVKLVQDEQVVGLALPGDYIGLGCLYESVQIETAIALERSRVCLLHSESELGQHAESVRLLTKEMQQKRWLTRIQQKPARARVCAWLIQISEHHKSRGLSQDRFRLPLNRTDLASYLGLALETVSRLLTGLHNDGLIELHGREITILDRTALSAESTAA